MVTTETMNVLEFNELFNKVKKEKKPVDIIKNRKGYAVKLRESDIILEQFVGDDLLVPVQFCLFHKLNYTVSIPDPSGPGFNNKLTQKK